MTFIKELWKGEKSLVFTYWVMGGLIPISYELLLRAIGYYELSWEGNEALTLFIEWSYYLYSAFIDIAIWRSATAFKKSAVYDFSKSGVWGSFAQIDVLGRWLYWIYSILAYSMSLLEWYQ